MKALTEFTVHMRAMNRVLATRFPILKILDQVVFWVILAVAFLFGEQTVISVLCCFFGLVALLESRPR